MNDKQQRLLRMKKSSRKRKQRGFKGKLSKLTKSKPRNRHIWTTTTFTE